MTVSLFCSGVLGEKVKPLVIWKYANLRCFKGIKKRYQSYVQYYPNKNAWMTSGVFETWLKKLNRKMAFGKKDSYSWTMRHPVQQSRTAT